MTQDNSAQLSITPIPKTPLLTTGLSGLVGSTFKNLYSKKYQITNLDISQSSNPVDITQYDQVLKSISDHPASTIIHLAAFTNVSQAYEQNNDTAGLAYQVNVVGTQNIAQAAKDSGKHLIHISTAFVFNGNKDSFYTESDLTNPIEWYGHTKALAEEKVNSILDSDSWTILRIDFPFRSRPFERPDIVRKNIKSLEMGYPLFDDHFFGPTFLDDFSKVLDFFIKSQTSGIFHATAGEKWSDFELGLEIVKRFGLNYQVKPGKLADYLKKHPRPYQKNTALDVSKLAKILPFTQTSIKDALKKVILS
jgi:dTDP-4-dehydrorhamnose reductase